MIKISATYSRKVPGSEQYSSEQAGATIEMELDSVFADKIQDRMDDLYREIKATVDRQLAGDSGEVPFDVPPAEPENGQPVQTSSPSNGNGSNGNGQHNGNGRSTVRARHAAEPTHVSRYMPRQQGSPSSRVSNGQQPANAARQPQGATKKQIGFLLTVARRNRNWSADDTRQWVHECFGCSLDGLSKQQAGQLIDELQASVPA